MALDEEGQGYWSDQASEVLPDDYHLYTKCIPIIHNLNFIVMLKENKLFRVQFKFREYRHKEFASLFFFMGVWGLGQVLFSLAAVASYFIKGKLGWETFFVCLSGAVLLALYWAMRRAAYKSFVESDAFPRNCAKWHGHDYWVNYDPKTVYDVYEQEGAAREVIHSRYVRFDDATIKNK